jgi:hypothetical protein
MQDKLTLSKGDVRRVQVSMIALVLSVLLFPGCTTAALVGYGATRIALNARPDQTMQYRIDVSTVDGHQLQFQGTAFCEHEANLESGGYKIKNPVAWLKKDKEIWLLSELSCRAVEGKTDLTFTLYRSVGEKLAHVYFVRPGGHARVTGSDFQWSPGTLDRDPPVRYNMGPFGYRKRFLQEPDENLRDLAEPTLLHLAETAQCSRMQGFTTPTLRIARGQWVGLTNEGYRVLRGIEHGVLKYRSDDSWILSPGISEAAPADATDRLGWDQPHLNVWAHCMTIVIGGTSVVTSRYGFGLIYLPDERAILEVGFLTGYGFSEFGKGNTNALVHRPSG